jgi:uncharacterized protein
MRFIFEGIYNIITVSTPTKRKIINDPVYGFVTVRHAFILELIDHPWFQRLRRIAQLGLSHLVYPGAVHNRFQHAIGAMHLTQMAIDEIRHRGHEITADEEIGLLTAILLHDIGHGPFSHALEHSIVENVHHEDISLFMMNELNKEYNGKLDIAIQIFNDQYHKRFLHQLVSSQLDLDRMDYLARDSFFSGVVEGQVGSERILKMLDVVNDQLVVEEKGMYSVEKFIVARRFMYWQVYLHKTVLSAEFMLVNALRRAKFLAMQGEELFATPSLRYFLYNSVSKESFFENSDAVMHYAQLDDYDINSALKVWQNHPDRILSDISSRIINRKLFKIELSREPFSDEQLAIRREAVIKNQGISEHDLPYYFIHQSVDNLAYNQSLGSILIKMKNGDIVDAAEASEQLEIAVLSAKVRKYFVAWAK